MGFWGFRGQRGSGGGEIEEIRRNRKHNLTFAKINNPNYWGNFCIWGWIWLWGAFELGGREVLGVFGLLGTFQVGSVSEGFSLGKGGKTWKIPQLRLLGSCSGPLQGMKTAIFSTTVGVIAKSRFRTLSRNWRNSGKQGRFVFGFLLSSVRNS